MLNGLRHYYTESGIAAEQFRCPMAESCGSVGTQFISACEAFVGTEYEAGTLPRVLFISLDPAPIAHARGRQPPSFTDIHKYFAHTNSAKCKDAAQGTGQGRARLFKNCRRFIPGEVRALQPDVIVTQGSLARESIRDAFPVRERKVAPGNPQYGCQVIEIGRRAVLEFDMVHPTARLGLYQQEVREAWEWYMSVGHAFLLKPEA